MSLFVRCSHPFAPSSCSLKQEKTVPWRRWKRTSVWRSVKVTVMERKSSRPGRKLAKRSKGSEDVHQLRNCLLIHLSSPDNWTHWWTWLLTTRTGEDALLFVDSDTLMQLYSFISANAQTNWKNSFVFSSQLCLRKPKLFRSVIHTLWANYCKIININS